MVTARVYDKVVFLDTNMLTVPAQFGVDVYSELDRLLPGFKFKTLSGCIRELSNISEKSNKLKIIVRLSKEIMCRNNIEVVENKGYVDDQLVSYGQKGAVIATNDKRLKKRLKNKGVKIAFLKQKKVIDLD